MTEFLVHGHGWAEVLETETPEQAVASFRRLATPVNPGVDLYALDFEVDPVTYDDPLWDSEVENQHKMSFGLTDEFD